MADYACEFVGGPLDGLRCPVSEVKDRYWNGIVTWDGTEVRKNGGICHRAELDGQPHVNGYTSPMWNDGELRYESWDVYDMMSR